VSTTKNKTEEKKIMSKIIISIEANNDEIATMLGGMLQARNLRTGLVNADYSDIKETEDDPEVTFTGELHVGTPEVKPEETLVGRGDLSPACQERTPTAADVDVPIIGETPSLVIGYTGPAPDPTPVHVKTPGPVMTVDTTPSEPVLIPAPVPPPAPAPVAAPVPTPEPVAPVAPPAPAPVPAAPVTPATDTDEPFKGLDTSGRGWDSRIDSSNGMKTKKGVWQKRKKVSPELRAQVLAELRSGAVAPEATPPAPAGVVPPAPVAPVVPAPVAPVVPAPVVPAAAPQVPPVDPNQFKNLPDFMQYVDECNIDQESINAACLANGVQSVAMLGSANYARFIPNIVQTLEAERHV
jgi:hypothetical protein